MKRGRGEINKLISAILGLVLVLLVSQAGSVAAEEITIAAASDLNFAFKDLVAEFEKTSGHHVKLSLGSSGNFYAQIQNGAPFDLYFSADIGYPKKLVEAGLADGATLLVYSRGHLVLWVPKGSPIPVEQLGMKALLHPAAKKVAIANPRHAPYGRAAEAALSSLGLLEAVRPRLVFGENIGQTAQFVQTGAADIGILALSLAKAPVMAASGRLWEVPLDAYPPLEQGGVILTHARNRAAALAFRDFLRSPAGTAIFTSGSCFVYRPYEWSALVPTSSDTPPSAPA